MRYSIQTYIAAIAAIFINFSAVAHDAHASLL